MEGDRREGVRRGECKGEVRRGMEGRKWNQRSEVKTSSALKILPIV